MTTSTRTRRARSALAAATTGAIALGLLPVGLAPASAATLPPVQPTDAFCVGVAPDHDVFEDIAGTTFEQDIRCLSWAEITYGAGAGDPIDPRDVYLPGRRVTRGQMATFIARTMDTAWFLDESGEGVQPLGDWDDTGGFTDVPGSHVHAESIERLAAAGVVVGGPAGAPASRFGPDLAVTRAQMATFIARADAFLRGRAIPVAPNFFTDDETSAHRANIDAVASLGIAVGDGRSRFNPAGVVNRGQMAAFLVRTLARLEADGLIAPVWDLLDVPDEALSTVVAVDNGDGSATIRFQLRNYQADAITGLGAADFILYRDGVEELWLDELVAAAPTAWSFAEVGDGVYEIVHTPATNGSTTIDLVAANYVVLAEGLVVTVTGAAG